MPNSILLVVIYYPSVTCWPNIVSHFQAASVSDGHITTPGKQVLRVCCAAVSDCWSVLYLPQNNINDQLQALALLENALAVAGAMHVAYFDTDTDDPG